MVKAWQKYIRTLYPKGPGTQKPTSNQNEADWQYNREISF